MTQNPLVTVITPSYNQADYLEQTLTSVIEQDYPNLEYFVVDGGSSDGSLDIIHRYAHKLDWWVSEPDKGQAEAINKGLARAKGKYAAWLNSDDYYLPGTVAKAVALLEENPSAGLVYADMHSVNLRGEVVRENHYQAFSLEDLLSFRIIAQPTVFMRRSVLEKAGGLSLDYNYLLDHHLWLRISAIAELKYHPEAWAAARYHPQAKNFAQAAGFGAEAYRILKWAETQPGLAKMIDNNPKKVWAGAHRFNARYLLDGGKPWQSLKAYWQVFTQQPKHALAHWRRILFAFISLFGLGGLRRLIYRRYY